MFIWDLSSGKLIADRTGAEKGIHCIQVSPDRKLVAIGSAGPKGAVELWDVSTILQPGLPESRQE
jgi:WD40 repeat protein